MGRVAVLTTFRTGDDVVDKNLDHFKQTLNPVLRNPVLSAADFQWIEVAPATATATPTFALQYRTQEKWATVLTVDATGQIVQPAWINVTYANSWVDLGAPSPSTAYYKDSFGLLHGRIYTKNGTVNTAFFNLPAAYRPAKDLNPTLCWSSGTGAQPLAVKANGDVGFIGAGNTSIVGEFIADLR